MKRRRRDNGTVLHFSLSLLALPFRMYFHNGNGSSAHKSAKFPLAAISPLSAQKGHFRERVDFSLVD